MPRSLVLAAFWVEADTDLAGRVADVVLKNVGAPGSKSIQTFSEAQVDGQLTLDLARLGVTPTRLGVVEPGDHEVPSHG